MSVYVHCTVQWIRFKSTVYACTALYSGLDLNSMSIRALYVYTCTALYSELDLNRLSTCTALYSGLDLNSMSIRALHCTVKSAVYFHCTVQWIRFKSYVGFFNEICKIWRQNCKSCNTHAIVSVQSMKRMKVQLSELHVSLQTLKRNNNKWLRALKINCNAEEKKNNSYYKSIHKTIMYIVYKPEIIVCWQP